MTIELPLWGQAGQYAARLDRQFIDRVCRQTQRVFDGLLVVQQGSGDANLVRIGVGSCAVKGTDQPGQGMYFVNVTADETLSLPNPPGSNSQYHLVVMRVKDQQAGGPWPAGTLSAVLDFVSGAVAAAPTIPAVPASSVPLAAVLRTSGVATITTSAITDRRPFGPWPYQSGTAAPTIPGVDGDLYVRI